MTARERFLRLMRYEPVDGLPVFQVEPFEASAVERWRSEGLPADTSPVEFLGMDALVHVGGVGVGPDPPFETRVIEENEEYLVETSSMGATIRRSKVAPRTFYGHVAHPIKSVEDWPSYRERLRPGTPGRVRGDLTPERVRQLNESPNPVALALFPFFFRLGFYSMGMEFFLRSFHEHPDMIHEMFSAASRLVLAALGPILGRVRVDFAYFCEDLAFKNGTLVSPRMYAEFWSPYQRPIIERLREHGVPVIAHWSSGQLEPLLPELLAQGFNCIGPVERLAGMDAADLRRRYGKDLLMIGNIAKEALLAGPAEIDREIERLGPLIRQGGFLPNLDDMTPMECPLSHYRHLIRRLRG